MGDASDCWEASVKASREDGSGGHCLPSNHPPTSHPHTHTTLRQVVASAAIPLRQLLAQRRLSGSWRLREAGGGAAVHEADRLDLGRTSLQLGWFALQAPPPA